MARVGIVTMTMFLSIVSSTYGGAAAAEVYKVGGSLGWATNMDYESWAASIDFHVGDTLLFEYNKEYHNVARVTTQEEYDSCNQAAAIAIWDTGNDSFVITRPGHYYFIGDCPSRHKLDIWASTDIGLDSPSPSGPISRSPSGHMSDLITCVIWGSMGALLVICILLVGWFAKCENIVSLNNWDNLSPQQKLLLTHFW